MAVVDLPAMSEAQAQVNQALCAELAQTITQQGPMPFAEYMHRCLYEPGLGYYVNGLSKLGADGDFVTAPELSDDLARCVAAQAAEVFGLIGGGSMLEFGGGSGQFAVDILLELKRLEHLPEHYLLLDVSADLKHQQQQLVAQLLPAELAARVQWVDTFVEGFRGVVVANELFDAFPVERFSIDEGIARRWCVDFADGRFSYQTYQHPDTANYVERLLVSARQRLTDGYASEFCPVMMPWWQSLAESFDTGTVIVLDYGCERSRYYSPMRSEGSTRCFFRHTLHDNALIYQGVQDITADVDFTALAESAVASGFALEGYTSMTQFMLSLGVIDRHRSQQTGLAEKQRVVATGKLKQLLLPEEMGERFMVAGFSRNIEPVLRGFAQGDQSRLL